MLCGEEGAGDPHSSTTAIWSISATGCSRSSTRPGHSPGGIALFEKATETLFSGDILYDGPLIEDTYHSNAEDYLASMERLLKLPVRIVHGGHFPSFGGERYRQLITDWLNEKHKTI